MNTHDNTNGQDRETRVLEYLEGGLSPEQERAFLAEAEQDAELKALLDEYRNQDRLLHGFHAVQSAAADRVRHPDLSSLASAQVAAPRRNRAAMWMAAAAAAAVLATSALVLRPGGETIPLGTVSYVVGEAQAFDDGKVVALAENSVLTRETERIKTPARGTLEFGIASGGAVEMNENSTVRLREAGKAQEIVLDRGEVLVHSAPALVRTPWFSAQSDDAAFSIVRGVRGAEVAVARGSVEVRENDKRIRVNRGETWSSTGSRTIPVANRVAWSRHSKELTAGLPFEGTPVALAATETKTIPGPVLAATVSASMPATAATVVGAPGVVKAPRTTNYLPESCFGFIEFASTTSILNKIGANDLSDALLGDRMRGIAHAWIDKVNTDEATRERMRTQVNEFFSDANLNLVLSSLKGGLSIGIAPKGPILIAEVTENRAEVEQLINVTLRDKVGVPDASQAGERFMLSVANGYILAGVDREAFLGTAEALRRGTPTAFATSPFLAEVRASASESGSPFIAASNIAALGSKLKEGSSEAKFFQRAGLDNLRTIIATPGFRDDADNRALQVRFDGARHGAMGWLGKPGPIMGYEFFSPDTHALSAARIETPLAMLEQIVAWDLEERGGDRAKLENDADLQFLNSFAATLGNEVVIGLDNPVLPVPNLKMAIELKDPVGFHDGMLRLVDLMSADLRQHGSEIVSDAATYRNHLIVDLRVPGKLVGVSYAVVDDYAVFGPGRPFLQAAIDTFVDNRSIAQEPSFISALPAKSGSNVSWMLYLAHNESMQNATPYLSQLLANNNVPVDLGAIGNTIPNRSVVLYAIAGDERIDYYVEGLKGDFEMTGMLPAVTEWLAKNGGE